jgi:hypothetical protein
MFKGATFKFTQPFCDCEVLNYGYGLSAINGAPAFIFQCSTCGTTVSMPMAKLSAGFEFDYMAPGVRVGGRASGEPDKSEDSNGEEESSLPVVEKENVIYGPWAGSDRPEIPVEIDETTNEVS